MKKLIKVLPLLLCGCNLQNMVYVPETIPNNICEDFSVYKVSQLIDRDNGVLAVTCSTVLGKVTQCDGPVIFVPNTNNQTTMYDEKIVKIDSDFCPHFKPTTYQYQTKDGTTKNVPYVEFLPSFVPNPEYK